MGSRNIYIIVTAQTGSPTHHDEIRSRQDYKDFLHADLIAHNVQAWHWYEALRRPTLHYQRVLRSVEYLRNGSSIRRRVLYVLQRIRLARLSVRTGLSIPPGVFGRGLSVAHYGSIVVNDRARVGRYCRIHSGTNIGENREGAPLVGDFAYIGPGAVLYGPVIIGDEVAIGANSVVNKSFGSFLTIAGSPAKLISDVGSRSALPSWFPDA